MNDPYGRDNADEACALADMQAREDAREHDWNTLITAMREMAADHGWADVAGCLARALQEARDAGEEQS